jgi:hypothetical protein
MLTSNDFFPHPIQVNNKALRSPIAAANKFAFTSQDKHDACLHRPVIALWSN